jgi:flavin-dependent dehydrogenase
MSKVPALIIGGGPAGSIAALHLARGGARPLLVERSREGHDPVCGGFVSADALRLLSRSGIDTHRLHGHPIERMRFLVAGRTIETALPFPAIGLSRQTLDTMLIEAARSAGAGVEFGRTARTLSGSNAVSFADGETIAAEAIILATGKLNLRGADRPGESAHGSAKVGLRRTLRPNASCAAALTGAIELHLFAGGYAGLVLQEDGLLNLCLSVSARRLRAAGGSPDRLLASIVEEAPLLGERLAAATMTDAWRSIARIPYGWRATETEPGLFRVGDQAAVIASLAGDGIAIAIASATAAAHALLRGGPAAAPAFQRDFARAARWPLAFAEALRRIAETPGWARPVARMVAIRPDVLAWGARATRIAEAA